MGIPNPNADDGQRLKRLIKEAGYISVRMDAHRRTMSFTGRTREWNIVARLHNGWLNLYTLVCDLPVDIGVRTRTLETMMRLNQQMLMAKFISAPHLALELDYRADHVDGETFSNLVGNIYKNAEEYYPEIFRKVTGDDVLEALGNIALPGAV
jgi:hypothetical protein